MEKRLGEIREIRAYVDERWTLPKFFKARIYDLMHKQGAPCATVARGRVFFYCIFFPVRAFRASAFFSSVRVSWVGACGEGERTCWDE